MQVATRADYTVKSLDEIERAFGGAFARVRAELGVTAFGLQVIDLPPNSGDLFPEHDHLHDGQEEVYLPLAGSGELALPDGSVALEPGVFARVGPSTRRRVRSGPDGLRILALGGIPGRAYEPAPNTLLGGPEILAETASSSMLPDGPPPQLA